jgi:hypothetical protein
MKRRFLSVLVLLALAACTPSEMKHDFAAHYGCPEDKVEVDDVYSKQLGTTGYKVSGCGSQVVFTCHDGRCASPQITIAKRHSREFDCRFSQVGVEYLDGGAWKASGCGHDTTYHCVESDQVALRCFAETADRDSKQLGAGAHD